MSGCVPCEVCGGSQTRGWHRHPPKTATLSHFLFDRQADSCDADSAMRELAWIDPNIRSFWIAEAGAVLAFIAEGD